MDRKNYNTTDFLVMDADCGVSPHDDCVNENNIEFINSFPSRNFDEDNDDLFVKK